MNKFPRIQRLIQIVLGNPKPQRRRHFLGDVGIIATFPLLAIGGVVALIGTQQFWTVGLGIAVTALGLGLASAMMADHRSGFLR